MEQFSSSEMNCNGTYQLIEENCNYSGIDFIANFSIPDKTRTLPAYIFWYVTSLNAIIFITGVSGNILVFSVIRLQRSMRTHMNYLLCSLSAADLLVLFICLPIGLAEFYGKDRWFLGETMCKIIPLLENASLNASVITLLTISYGRYKAICSSTVSDEHSFTRRYPIRSVILIWLSSYMMALPFIFMTHLEKARFYDGSQVHVCRTKVLDTWNHCFIITMFVLFFAVPLVILFFLYILIIRKIQLAARAEGKRHFRQRKQAIIMIMIVIAVFFISLLPIKVITLWIIYSPIEDKINLGFIPFVNIINMARILMYINSAVNPLIYALVSKRFRIAFKKLTRSCSCERLLHISRSKLSPDETRPQCRDGRVRVYRFNTKLTNNVQLNLYLS